MRSIIAAACFISWMEISLRSSQPRHRLFCPTGCFRGWFFLRVSPFLNVEEYIEEKLEFRVRLPCLEGLYNLVKF